MHKIISRNKKKANKTRFLPTHLFFCHSGTPCITTCTFMPPRLRVHVYGKSDSHAYTGPVNGSRTIHHASMRFLSSPHWTTLSTKVKLPPLPSFSILSLFLSHSLFPLSSFFILLGCDRRVFIAMCPWNSDNDRLTFPALSNSAAPVKAAALSRSDWRLSIFCFFFFHGFVSLLRQHYIQLLPFLPLPLVPLFLFPTLIYKLPLTSVGNFIS